MFLLFVTHPTGYVQVLSFPSAFARGLDMIRLAPEPVVLRPADY